MQGINLQSAKGSNTWVRCLRSWNDTKSLICWFFCSTDKNIVYKIHYHQSSWYWIFTEKRCLYGNRLAGWHFEGYLSPLLLCIALCTGRTGQEHSGCTDNSKIDCVVFCWKMGTSSTSKLIQPGQLWMSSQVMAASVTWCLSHAGTSCCLAEQCCSFP